MDSAARATNNYFDTTRNAPSVVSLLIFSGLGFADVSSALSYYVQGRQRKDGEEVWARLASNWGQEDAN